MSSPTRSFPDPPPGLLAAVRDEPEELAPRLVLADWMEEHGHPAAELLRALNDRLAIEFPMNRPQPAQADQAALMRHVARLWLGDLAGVTHLYWDAGLPVVQFSREKFAAGWSESVQRGLEQGWARWVDLRLFSDGEAPLLAEALGEPAVRERLRHVNSLNLQNYCGDEAFPHIAPLESIERIEMNSSRATDDALAHLVRMTRLRELRLPQGITGAGLRTLAATGRLAGLRHLHMHRPDLTDADLAVFAKPNRLERLNLFWVPRGLVDGSGLAHLAGCERLYTLELGDLGLRRHGLGHLPELPRLRRLVVSWSNLGETLLQHAARQRTVEELSFWHVPIKATGLRHLAGLPALRHLDLSGTKVQVKPLDHLAALPRLDALNLSHTPLGAGAIAPLGRAAGLRFLDLSGTSIQGADLRPLVALTRLECLRLARRMHGEALAQLEGLPALRELSLGSMTTTDDHLAALACLPSLRVLRLEVEQGSPLTGAGLAHLAGLPDLHSLDLSGRPITDDALAHLSALPGLRSLCLDNTAVTDAGLAHVARLKQLRYLHLSGTKITDAGLKHLRGMPSLLLLNIGYTALTSDCIGHLRTMPALIALHHEATYLSRKALGWLPAHVHTQPGPQE